MDSKKRILIVDDEQINLEFFDVMLSKLGFQVGKAEDGEAALAEIKRFKPDLILLDNIMPKLSGWEVTRILKTREDYREFSEVPIIMFSAMDDVKDKVEGFELGVDDYITKPYNFSEVLARIKSLLRTRELVNQLEKREQRIALTEKLNAGILEFVDGLRKDVAEAAEAAAKEPSTPFLDKLRSDFSTIAKRLESIDEAAAKLKAEEAKIKKTEIEIQALRGSANRKA